VERVGAAVEAARSTRRFVHARSICGQQLGFDPMAQDQTGCVIRGVVSQPERCVGN
jgi:hypothetical protein